MGFLLNNKEKSNFSELDYKVVNNIKSLAIDMINEAKSGHPGIVLGAAPIIYDIYARHLVFDPKNDKWINRDRFIMSCGHGSALLYATLYFAGFNITIEDLKKFRKFSSRTPGHPEYNVTPGVDMSTGPLGQGIAGSVGIAIGERYLNKRYSYGKNSLIDHYTYVLCGDGDLMEGVSYEASSIAGNLSLGKLIVIYDSNNMTLDGSTKETFKENVLDRFKAMNWDTHLVQDGRNLDLIDNTITKAKECKDKPSFIEVKTTIGLGSKLENTNLVHGKCLDEEDITNLKEKLGIRDVPFTILEEAYTYMKEQISKRNEKIINEYNKNLAIVLPKAKEEYKKEFENLLEGKNEISFKNVDIDLKEDLTGRDISSIILNKICKENKLIIGGSSDVASSTKTYIEDGNNFTSSSYDGRNILFGVREHAMGAILNGIALSNIRCFGSTFLAFSDYLKPAIRMSAIMNLPVVYIFTHDNILVGEDGPTHEPVEQLVMLRSIPNLNVYRPGDANEILGAYKSAFKNTNPSAIILSKNKMKTYETTKINDVDKGAYIVIDYENYTGILIATGSELQLAINISNRLAIKHIYTRVVSMPSIELFKKQDAKYKENILPLTSKKIVIEFSSSYSWYEFVYSDKYLFTIDNFGKSAKKEELEEHLGLTEESLYEKIEELLK